MRKPIQIAVTSGGYNPDVLFVLCDDGKIYMTWYLTSYDKQLWKEVDGLPQDEVKNGT